MSKFINFILSHFTIILSFISLTFNFSHFNSAFVSAFNKFSGLDLMEEPSFNNEVLPIVDNEIFSSVFKTVRFSSTKEIDKVLVEGNINFSSFSYKDGLVDCTFSEFKDSSKIIVSFFHENVLIDKCALYFLKISNVCFCYSTVSLDIAKRIAGHKLFYNLVKDTNDRETFKIKMESPKSKTVSNGYVYGTLKWADEHGNVHPLIDAKIVVTMSNNIGFIETFSNEKGNYLINYPDAWHFIDGVPTVHIYAENDHVKVSNDGSYEKTYKFSSSNGGEFSYTFSPDLDGDMGKAMMVFQGARNFSDYAIELNGGQDIEFCNILYPYGTGKSSYLNGTIRLSGKILVRDGLPESYACWDVIGHEYAYHLQKIFGISDNPGGAHTISFNNIDEQMEGNIELHVAKERGHKLSWAEGWASYWSIVAQSYFSEEMKTINTIGDKKYTSYNGVNYSLDSYEKGHGDADEQVVQRFLFRIYDSTINEVDKFDLGDLLLWNVVVDNKPFTFYEFIEDLYNLGLSKNDLGILLDVFGVFSPDLKHTAMRFTDRSPTFFWSTDMGSENLRFDEFDFYIKCGVQEFKQLGISSDDEFASFSSLSIRTWKSIIGVKNRYIKFINYYKKL